MSLQLTRVQSKSIQLVSVTIILVGVNGFVDPLQVLLSIWTVFFRSEDEHYSDCREIQI
jgi:hypothetical protein